MSQLGRGGEAIVHKIFGGALDGRRVRLVRRGLGDPGRMFWVVKLEGTEYAKIGGGPRERCVHESELEPI